MKNTRIKTPGYLSVGDRVEVRVMVRETGTLDYIWTRRVVTVRRLGGSLSGADSVSLADLDATTDRVISIETGSLNEFQSLPAERITAAGREAIASGVGEDAA